MTPTVPGDSCLNRVALPYTRPFSFSPHGRARHAKCLEHLTPPPHHGPSSKQPQSYATDFFSPPPSSFLPPPRTNSPEGESPQQAYRPHVSAVTNRIVKRQRLLALTQLFHKLTSVRVKLLQSEQGNDCVSKQSYQAVDLLWHVQEQSHSDEGVGVYQQEQSLLSETEHQLLLEAMPEVLCAGRCVTLDQLDGGGKAQTDSQNLTGEDTILRQWFAGYGNRPSVGYQRGDRQQQDGKDGGRDNADVSKLRSTSVALAPSSPTRKGFNDIINIPTQPQLRDEDPTSSHSPGWPTSSPSRVQAGSKLGTAHFNAAAQLSLNHLAPVIVTNEAHLIEAIITSRHSFITSLNTHLSASVGSSAVEKFKEDAVEKERRGRRRGSATEAMSNASGVSSVSKPHLNSNSLRIDARRQERLKLSSPRDRLADNQSNWLRRRQEKKSEVNCDSDPYLQATTDAKVTPGFIRDENNVPLYLRNKPHCGHRASPINILKRYCKLYDEIDTFGKVKNDMQESTFQPNITRYISAHNKSLDEAIKNKSSDTGKTKDRETGLNHSKDTNGRNGGDMGLDLSEVYAAMDRPFDRLDRLDVSHWLEKQPEWIKPKQTAEVGKRTEQEEWRKWLVDEREPQYRY
eukprot:GHVN01014406.1.p1 GENE.GHVN01014406.1~~GHVN01014406.1.p1  ORF type:complete len:649 (+),score=123.16 GHVN01014406.1:69-1949(+)